MTILDHLCATADLLDANIQTHGLPLTTQDTMRTLRIAADFLYDAAELVSVGSRGCNGEPISAPDVAVAISLAVAKLEEVAQPLGAQPIGVQPIG